MDGSETREGAVETSIVPAENNSDLVQTGDSFSRVNREIDTLYQRIKDGDTSAIAELRALNMAVRLKITLADFKEKMAGR